MENQTKVTADLVVIGPNNPGQQVQPLVEVGNRIKPQQIEAVLLQLSSVTATLGLVSTNSTNSSDVVSPHSHSQLVFVKHHGGPLLGLQVQGARTTEERAHLDALVPQEAQACADSTLGPVTVEALFPPKAMDELDALVIAVAKGELDTEALRDALLVHQPQDATPPHQGDGTSSEVDPQVLQCLQGIIAQLELLRNQKESQPSSACSTPRRMFGPVDAEPSLVPGGGAASSDNSTGCKIEGLQAEKRLFPESQIPPQARALRERLNAALQGRGITAEVIVNGGASPDQWELTIYMGTTEEQAKQLASTLTSQYSSVPVKVETGSEPDTSNDDTISPANGSSNNRSRASTPDALPEQLTSDTTLIGVSRDDAKKHAQGSLNSTPTAPKGKPTTRAAARAAGNNDEGQNLGSSNYPKNPTGVSRGDAKDLAHHAGLSDRSEPNQMIEEILIRHLGMTPRGAREGVSNLQLLEKAGSPILCHTPRSAIEPENTPASQAATAAAAVQQGLLSPRSSQLSNSKAGGSPQERYVMGPLAIRVVVKQALV
jgi:hypothetical protein